MTFDDVVSQPHITATLSRQVAEGKTAHAYLFTGSRGTGKTTCARILAKAVNCLNPKDGKPCLECEICRAADAGTLSDIIEIDGASNNGIEDVRDLRDSAVYTPERCRYKVYIIDEVHMISPAAFNALLKIMEEPPEHVKFILATTEAHKVPATIVSRCQRFDFRRIREEDIVQRLMYIAKCEEIDLLPDAAALIARLSDGAMRDALSLLDQCVAYSDHIDRDTVSNAAGVAGRGYLFDILEAAVRGDTPQAITVVDELYSKSKDMSRLCDELLLQMRNLMLIKTVPGKPELLSCFDNETERLSALADVLTLGEILSKLQILQSCAEALPRAVSKRTEFEMTIIKLCAATKLTGFESPSDSSTLEKRIARLESELESLKSQGIKPAAPVSKPKPQDVSPIPSKAPVTQKPQSESLPPAVLCDRWDEIIDRLTELNPGCASALRGSEAYIQGNRFTVYVNSKLFLTLVNNEANSKAVKQAVLDVTGVNYEFRAKPADGIKKSSEKAADPVEELIKKAKEADIPVDVE